MKEQKSNGGREFLVNSSFNLKHGGQQRPHGIDNNTQKNFKRD